MTDHDLRALERAHAAAPTDETRDRLEIAWLRAGLGWHGEDLRPFIDLVRGAWLDVKRDERGVYRWLRHDVPIEASPEMVYVPGGDAGPCDRCDPVQLLGRRCSSCRGTRRHTIAPFYVGRFPVTWREWRAFVQAAGYNAGRVGQRGLAQQNEIRFHPTTHVSHADALAFCSWAGLRLPSAQEWLWTALGAPERCMCEGLTASSHAGWVEFHRGNLCREQDGKRVRPRCYPWGNDPPSPEFCVWAGHPEFGDHVEHVIEHADGIESHGRVGRSAPVVVVERCVPHEESPSENGRCEGPFRLVSARPAGASWCGAHDMAGNVWEMTSEGDSLGGSFRTDRQFETAFNAGHEDVRAAGRDNRHAADDVGFRVAVRA